MTPQLRVGVLGCGPIAQIAHFDACRKAHNATLYAVCDRAPDLVAEAVAVHKPQVAYADYDQMLADPQVEAVIIAVDDAFHVPLAQQALAAGKHVLVEKPMGVTVEECLVLQQLVQTSGLTLQVGHNKRFDPGVAFARHFIQTELGALLSLKAWYCDSAYRYTMTDNLQPLRVSSPQAVRPPGESRADRQRYLMLAHGSHLVDMARFLGGEIQALQARLLQQDGAFCWFVDVAFAAGGLGHLDLTIPVQGDWDEGFVVNGKGGSVRGKSFLPWYHKSSEVACFSARDGLYHGPLGADAYSYKLQIEGFAETILNGTPQHGAGVADGLASVQAMAAISRSVQTGQWVALNQVTGGV